MIELSSENLPIASERKLKLFLAKSELSILRRVVNAKSQFMEESALSEAFKSVETDDPQSLLSVASMRAARRYQTFIEVLDEIVAQSETETHFQIAKLKTSPDYANTQPSDGQQED